MEDHGNSGSGERETVRLDEVLKQYDVGTGRELSPTKIGYHLALFVLLYIGIVTAVLLAGYFFNSPTLPDPDKCDPGMLENYEKLSSTAIDRTLKLFDQLIHKSILPIFSAILGYIFGIRGMEKDAS